MKKHLFTRLLSLVLAAVMILGLFPAVSAAPVNLRWEKSDVNASWDKTDRLAEDEIHTQTAHKPTDMVRVSIVLEDAPTLKAGYSTNGIGANADARAYDRELKKAQEHLAEVISAQALGGKELDVVWNLTLAANIISANVPYAKIDAVKAVEGVQDVVLETRYEAQTDSEAAPNMYSSAGMVGSPAVWQTGMTGAGTRVAIVDTGTDTDHQSFANAPYLYALEQNAAARGQTLEEYTASLDLLDEEEIAGVLGYLNAYERIGVETASDYYINEKLPFGANYVDYDLNVTHDFDQQGSHGSHVAGIAAANRFIAVNGAFESARETVLMNGVAPDAQIITLKVFGNAAGPYDSDYFAAIEDAIWLSCDSVNLSLGSGSPGYSRNTMFADLLNFMATTDTVVVMSAGNSGHWAENTAPTYLYNDGVSFQTDGSPGSYTNSLAVASVDNDGTVGKYFTIADRMFVYTETEYRNRPMAALDTTGSGTDYEYIFIDGVGKTEDYAGMDLKNKVVFCQRGEISFFEKGNFAAALGAAAIVVYNNVEEAFGMDLTDYSYTKPCVSILQSEGAAIKAASTEQTTEEGNVYYTGTITISGKLGGTEYNSDYYTMSDFSSWGIPGSLELKPEITAPGGMIWSVNGVDPSADAYEQMSGTSMAAPQVTGMAALVAEYIKANDLQGQTGLSVRQLAQSLLMSTAVPMREGASGGEYYSILNQGAGLARVDLATTAESYIEVFGQPDGKVKAELGDDPDRTGKYTVEFTINNLNGKAMTYELSADLFTQDLFGDDNGNLYLNTWTRSLSAGVSFSSEGQSLENLESTFRCDLNGDGATNTADADYLLEYLLGNVDALHDDGDVNGDGQITTYDAHVLLTRQTGGCAVDVPANGSVRVAVEMELTDDTKAFLDAYYPTGAYVEAYVYAEPVHDSEGVEGVVHSIPVLGYYGSWTEPSMYDVGSYLEYAAGAETRAPYLYSLNGIKSNYITINYGDGTEYLFGGNPYTAEDAYLPERNAINNKTGAMLQNLRFTQIRNAAAAKLVLENAETGEIYLEEQVGEIDGAYYHTNMAQWQNTQWKLPIGLDFAGMPEGTRLNLSLITAPEYYTWYDEETETTMAAWEKLGEGAYLTTSLTIDNTAPVLKHVEVGENNTLRITAQDNEYIAAVALMNAAGTNILDTAPANQTERGIEVTTALDLRDVFGNAFLVAVFDYAENQTVYEITLELENERPYFTALDRTNVNDDNSISYVGLESDGTAVTLAPASGRTPARAAEYVEGAVFEISNDNKLYVGFDEDLFSFTCLGDLDPSGAHEIAGFNDLAYNKADGKLYGLFYSKKNSMAVPYLCTIDLYTGEMTVLGQMPIDANTLAIDGEGNFYSTIYGASQLYTYTSDVISTRKATLVGQPGGYKTNLISSMAWDHNTDELYWAVSGNEAADLLKVDPQTAETEYIGRFGFIVCGLYIAYEPGSDLFAPTDEVLAVSVTEQADLVKGTSSQLSALVKPWNVSDASVVWTTSDDSVVTVDENGVIYGVGRGTAVVTATSVLDSTKSASCTVTVASLNKTLKGVVWDELGQVHWASFNTDTIPAYESLNAITPNLPVNATMITDGKLYASTLDTANGTSDLYTVDPVSFEMTKVGTSSVAYLDMSCAPSLGYGIAVYFNYIVLVDLESGDYLGAWDWAEGITADLVGITYYGTQYNSSYGVNMDYFLILDADGKVYLEAFINTGSVMGYFNGPTEGYIKTIGAPVDYSYFQGFHFDGAYTYWTRFNDADNVVELLVWDTEGSDSVYSLGYFAEGVWPVGGLYTDAEISDTNALIDEELVTASVRTAELMTAVPAVQLEAAKGSLNTVKPDSSASIDDVDGQISVAVTMPGDATNGIFTVAYDAELLRCSGAAPATDAMAYADNGDGTITVAFADRNAVPAGEAAAYVQFWAQDAAADETELTIRTTELNEAQAELEEKLTVELPADESDDNPFTDVPADSFYCEPVLWAAEKGITVGTGDQFNPQGSCVRAQVVTFLWRAMGQPEPEGTENPFADVNEGDFFYNAVLWAYENGITTGVDDDHFGSTMACNRAQVVTFLWRAMGQPEPDAAENPFADVHEGDFFHKAVLWAVENGITTGVDAGHFGPTLSCNRAQVVTFLYRAMA